MIEIRKKKCGGPQHTQAETPYFDHCYIVQG